jgi:hypothetical protein
VALLDITGHDRNDVPVRLALVLIAALVVGAGCSSDDRAAPLTEPTTASIPEGAAYTIPRQPSDVRPMVAACLAEAAGVGPSLNFSEGCNEAALATDDIGLDEIAADLREMMTTVDTAARLVIIKRVEQAIASL